MNVAITRAKELLIVVGKGCAPQARSILEKLPPILSQEWPVRIRFRAFPLLPRVDLASTFLRYEGPELDLDMDGNYMSRLE